MTKNHVFITNLSVKNVIKRMQLTNSKHFKQQNTKCKQNRNASDKLVKKISFIEISKIHNAQAHTISAYLQQFLEHYLCVHSTYVHT